MNPKALLLLPPQATWAEDLALLFQDMGWETVRETTTTRCWNTCLKLHHDCRTVILDPFFEGNTVQLIKLLAELPSPPALAFISAQKPRLVYAFRRFARSKGLQVIDVLLSPVLDGDLHSLVHNLNKSRRGLITDEKHAENTSNFSRKDLVNAIGRGDFVVYFQPRIELKDESVVGAEALVRWAHPTLGILGPDTFIPQMEHFGLIDDLTWVVLEQALIQTRIWHDTGYQLKVSVNFCASTLIQDGIEQKIKHALESIGVSASHLSVEVTETAMVSDFERLLEVVLSLHRFGIECSIDDYGTGYSSLQQVSMIPAEELKLDKSFIKNMTENQADYMIVRNTIKMAHELGMQVLAEGVETEEQKHALSRQGCNHAQGYLFGKPMPASEFLSMISTGRPD